MKEWIYGRNPVYETLVANRRHTFQLIIREGVKHKGRLQQIIQLCIKRQIPVRQVDLPDLDAISPNNQGVALQTSKYPYRDLDRILTLAEQRREQTLILILDTIQDPQNLGSLLRTAEIVGVHGIILPLRKTARVTPAVVAASSGASEHLLISQVNLVQGLNKLKSNGVWVIGLESSQDAQPLGQIDLNIPLALVVGNEESGMRPLTRNSCDLLLQIPMKGQVESLNAAVAGSVALYMAWQAREYT